MPDRYETEWERNERRKAQADYYAFMAKIEAETKAKESARIAAALPEEEPDPTADRFATLGRASPGSQEDRDNQRFTGK